MPSRLIIRADADSRMGTGHVMRCIALGQAWVDAGGKVIFQTCCENEALLKRLQDEEFEVLVVQERYIYNSTVLSALQVDAPVPWVVFDGYHFDLEQQRQVREAGCNLLLIDDYCHLEEYECDILVNQNISAPALDYHINADGKLLLGCDYALLRREFRQQLGKVERSGFSNEINLLVSMGGADPDNVTSTVIEAIAQIRIKGLHARVIVGPANTNLASLRKLVASSSHIELVSSVKDMTPLMKWADIAVSAGGSTCWELCYMGVPFVTVVLAENQRALVRVLEEREVAPCLGETPDVAAIVNMLDDLMFDLEKRERLSAAGRALVDGFGVDRILYQVAENSGVDIFESRLSLRPAVEDDCNLYWKWTNDPTVRGNSYTPDPISLEEHCAWYMENLAEESCLMLVFCLDGIPAGQIRYKRSDDVATIGFSIDRKFRGLGFGSRIVEESMGQAVKHLNVNTLKAEVFKGNPASKAVFMKTGFELIETCVINRVSSHVFIRKWS